MQDALDYARGTADQFSLLETEVDVGTNLTNYAILGSTVGGAAVAAYQASRDVLAGFGLATSGLLGFQYVTGINAKRKALDQGLSAIACVERNSIAASNLSQDALGTSPPLPAAGITGAPAAGGLMAPAAAQGVAPSAFVAFTTALQSNSTTNELATSVRPVSPPPGAAALPLAAPAAPAASADALNLARGVQASMSAQVIQAQQELDSSRSERNGAIQAVTESAPEVLVARVTIVKEAVFAAMHTAEPTGQQVSDYAQTMLKKAQTASDTTKTKSQNTSSKTATAIAVAPTRDVQDAAPGIQETNAQQEQDASKVSTVVDGITDEATTCKSLIDAIGKGQ